MNMLDGQGLGKVTIGKLMGKTPGEEIYRLLQMSEEYEDSFVLCKCSSKNDLAEEFNSQVNRITHSMDNQLLFLAIPVTDQWTRVQSDYSGRDGLDNIPLTKLTWLQLLLSSR